MSKWFKKDVLVSDSEEEEEDSEEDVYDEQDDSHDEQDDSDEEDESDDDDEEEEEEKETTGGSKWFKATLDSDDDDEDEDTDEDDDVDDVKVAPVAVAKKHERRMRRHFMQEDDEEDEKRVVKSHKSRRLSTLKEQIEKLHEIKRENRWRDALEAFLALNKALERVLKVQDNVPNMYIKCIVALEEAAGKAAKDKTAKSKLAAADSRVLGPVLSRLKKNNTQYKSLISKYETNPELFEEMENEEDEEEEELMEDDDEEEELVMQEKTGTAKPSGGKSRWFKDDESDDSESSDDDNDFDSDDMDDFDQEEDDDIGIEGAKITKQQKGKRGKKGPAKSTTQKIKSERAFAQPKKKTFQDIEWNTDLIDENISKIKQTKGKKGTDPQEQYELLEVLFKNSVLPSKQIEILLLMISISFDIVTAHFMPVQIWNNNYLNIVRILSIIDNLPSDVVLIELEESVPLISALDTPTKKEDEKTVKIFGNIVTIFERLDEEYTKSLRNTDPHMQEYVKRLNDECMLMDMSERLFVHYSTRGDMKKATRIASKIFDRIYYKKQEEHEKTLRRQREQITQILKEAELSFKDQVTVITEDLEKMIKYFSSLIYTHGTSEVMKTKTMLLLVYHLAVFDKFYEARDMLNMSRIQDTIFQLEIPLQVLYNRAIAQLGLCAFRNSMIHDAHSCLQELCSSSKTRDLLAQNIVNVRQLQSMTVTQRLEHDRLIPYHMHINLTKLEAVHLICAMLLEIPSMAQTGQTSRQIGGLKRRKVISKPLRKLMEMFERQIFIGPPDNIKEYIFAASKVLLNGNWEECYHLLAKLKVWNLVADSDTIKEMLKSKIKIEALRTYLFQFGRHYETISLQFLATKFDLPENKIHSIVSKMIINDELFAAWDQPTQCIIIDRSADLSHLQRLALQLAERTNYFVEMNEKTFDVKAGTGEYVSMPTSDRRRTGASSRPAGGDGGQKPRRSHQQSSGKGKQQTRKSQPKAQHA